MNTPWYDYVLRLKGRDSKRIAARRAGFDGSAFSRWSQGAKADPIFAVKFARAYGGNVLEALIATGLITEVEAGLTRVELTPAEALAKATPQELVEALHDQMGGVS